jgi:hypothetical protein
LTKIESNRGPISQWSGLHKTLKCRIRLKARSTAAKAIEKLSGSSGATPSSLTTAAESSVNASDKKI